MDQPEKERTLALVSGGTSIEAVAGVGTIVLAILGLAGVIPVYMTAIGTIAAGAGLFFAGGAIANRMTYLHAHAASDEKFARLRGGMSAEFIAGLGGIVLGILALIGIAPATLLPVAAITFGSGLLIGAGATDRLNDFPAFAREPSREEAWAREVASTAVGAQVFIGLAVLAMGIIALVGTTWMTLCLTALLCVGGSAFLTGSMLTSRLQAVLHHHVHHW